MPIVIYSVLVNVRLDASDVGRELGFHSQIPKGGAMNALSFGVWVNMCTGTLQLQILNLLGSETRHAHVGSSLFCINTQIIVIV